MFQACRGIGISMGNNRSRTGVLVGVAAAAGAFGAAAMLSAATAPTARADDFTDLINAVDGVYAVGEADFSTAFTDFGGGDVNDGLAAFFSGVDTDLLGAPGSLEIGTVQLLTTGTIMTGISFDVGAEPDFTSALTDAESFLADAQENFTSAVTYSSDLADVAYYDTVGSWYDVAALQVLLEGAVDSFR
jgi:hypothetical protein